MPRQKTPATCRSRCEGRPRHHEGERGLAAVFAEVVHRALVIGAYDIGEDEVTELAESRTGLRAVLADDDGGWVVGEERWYVSYDGYLLGRAQIEDTLGDTRLYAPPAPST